MKKPFVHLTALGLCLSLCLSLAVLAPARAAEQEEVLQVLALLSVMNGDENGDLNLTARVTRAQFAKMCVAASTLGSSGGSTGLAPFPDVPASHWAAGYIADARDAGWFAGDLTGNFRPDSPVTMAEAVTVVLRMLGYPDSQFTGQWPSGQMRLGRQLELDQDISAGQDQYLTRMECAQLIYNLLNTPTTAGQVYCLSLGCSLNAQGEVDSLTLMEQKLEGPILYTGSSLASAVGFTPGQVYLNGEKAQLEDVAPGQLVYYQKDAGVVFAYSTRRTGTINAISPNEDAPTSVTVAGVTYSLTTSQAAVSLSSQGNYHVGDRVTLLLGRGGGVAMVLGEEEANVTLCGVVTAITANTYTTTSGVQYTARAVEILATDGGTYCYETTVSSLEVGDLVQVDYSASQPVRRLTENSLSGTVTAAAIGSRQLAEDVEILDVWEGSGVTVSPERLRGCTLSSSDVRYVAYDSDGKISRLILDDYTGDIHSYGLLTKQSTTPTGQMTFVSNYTCLLGGSETSLTFTNTSFSLEIGGIQVRMEDGVPTKLYKLEKFSVRSAGSTWVSNGSQQFTLGDGLQVYVKQGEDWYLSDWTLVSDTGAYSLTAWYDARDNQGGRVRVITAIPR